MLQPSGVAKFLAVWHVSNPQVALQYRITGGLRKIRTVTKLAHSTLMGKKGCVQRTQRSGSAWPKTWREVMENQALRQQEEKARKRPGGTTVVPTAPKPQWTNPGVSPAIPVGPNMPKWIGRKETLREVQPDHDHYCETLHRSDELLGSKNTLGEAPAVKHHHTPCVVTSSIMDSFSPPTGLRSTSTSRLNSNILDSFISQSAPRTPHEAKGFDGNSSSSSTVLDNGSTSSLNPGTSEDSLRTLTAATTRRMPYVIVSSLLDSFRSQTALRNVSTSRLQSDIHDSFNP